MQGQVQQPAAHGVDLHALVARAGVSAHRRLLGLEDGHLGRGVRVLRSVVSLPAIPGIERDRPDQQDPQHTRHA